MDSETLDTIFRVLSALGGVGVIFWAVFKSAGKVFHTYFEQRARTHAEIELEQNRQRLGPIRLLADRYATSQFDVYRQLWESLHDLSVAGDNLWGKASKTNVEKFARQLRLTQGRVHKGAIFFDDQDYTKLQELLTAFGRFEIGKLRLREIRSLVDLDNFAGEIGPQIDQNRRYKEEYEAILDRIRVAFRSRLSRPE